MKIERNIAFISDINQAYYALTNCLMIKEQSKREVKVNLILSDIDENSKIKIESIIKHFDLNLINVKYINTTEMFLGKSKLKHVTNTTNLRLYLPSLLDEVQNVLYLDNDIVIDGDITDFFEYLDPKYSYGRPWDSKSYWYKTLKKKKMLKGKYYVNAGVIFLNLNKLRGKGIEQKMIDFLRENEKFIRYADQDALNCNIKFQPLPYNWNIARDGWEKHRSDIVEKSDLKVYHFLSHDKQWGDDISKITVVKDKGSLQIEELNKMIEPQKLWIKYYNRIKILIKD